MVRYPFGMRATYPVRCAHSQSGCLVHEINRKISSGAGKGMHPAASPFVAGKYGRKARIDQDQFFCWQINYPPCSASPICFWWNGWCGNRRRLEETRPSARSHFSFDNSFKLVDQWRLRSFDLPFRSSNVEKVRSVDLKELHLSPRLRGPFHRECVADN